jgi:hypothetical protein
LRGAQAMPSKLFGQARGANPLMLLPAFSGPARGRLPVPLQGGHASTAGVLGMRESIRRKTAQALFE